MTSAAILLVLTLTDCRVILKLCARVLRDDEGHHACLERLDFRIKPALACGNVLAAGVVMKDRHDSLKNEQDMDALDTLCIVHSLMGLALPP